MNYLIQCMYIYTLCIVCLQDGVGDANDFWEVDIAGAKQGDPVRTVASRLRFRHVTVGCYLHSHSKQLPKWWVY